jgi:hypothetical protein
MDLVNVELRRKPGPDHKSALLGSKISRRRHGAIHVHQLVHRQSEIAAERVQIEELHLKPM